MILVEAGVCKKSCPGCNSIRSRRERRPHALRRVKGKGLLGRSRLAFNHRATEARSGSWRRGKPPAGFTPVGL
jgi:hypothetical protein